MGGSIPLNQFFAPRVVSQNISKSPFQLRFYTIWYIHLCCCLLLINWQGKEDGTIYSCALLTFKHQNNY